MTRSMRSSTLFVLLASAGALCACNGGHHDDGAPPSFAGFVQGLASDTSDTSEAVPINGKTFTFSEDPHAFDVLFQ